MRNILVNPFYKLAGAQTLIIGLFSILLTSYLGSFNNIHFDGLLDIHLGLATEAVFYIQEGLINWISISLVLYIFSLLFSKSKVRLIDIFGTQALARIPYIVVSIIAFIPFLQNIQLFSINMIVFSVFMIIIIIWYIALMYHAYKVSSNLKGNTLVFSFIGGILIAEVLSKLTVYHLLKLSNIK